MTVQQKPKPKRTTYLMSYGLLIGWALLIFFLSSEGHSASSGRSDVVVGVLQGLGSTLPADILTVIARKGAHMVAYFILGLLAFNVVRLYALPPRRVVLVAMAIVIGYAASDEFHQHFVPGRSSELRDVLIDTTAGLVGVSTYAFIYNRRTAGRASNLNKPIK